MKSNQNFNHMFSPSANMDTVNAVDHTVRMWSTALFLFWRQTVFAERILYAYSSHAVCLQEKISISVLSREFAAIV